PLQKRLENLHASKKSQRHNQANINLGSHLELLLFQCAKSLAAILNGPFSLGMRWFSRHEKHNFTILFSKKSSVARKTRPKRHENLGCSII
ncbi:MAG: hypothetical protein ACYDC6_10990, partial [Acidobacteriaceae bacterium]